MADNLSQSEYVKAALKWQYNLIALAGSAGFALVSGNALPLILAAGAELMYLAIVPQSERFRRLVRSWRYEEDKRAHRQRLDQMCRNLPPEMRSRYDYLLQSAAAIRANYTQLSYASQVFATQMEVKLDSLLESYGRMLTSAHAHREYLQSLNPDQVRSEAAYLAKSLDKEPAKVRDINQRRIAILTKRVEKFEKIKENRQVIDAQCAAIEDILQLIRDQSVTMRDPQELTAQLEHLVADVEQTEQSVREMEEIFSLTDPEPLDEPQSTPSRGNRLRN